MIVMALTFLILCVVAFLCYYFGWTWKKIKNFFQKEQCHNDQMKNKLEEIKTRPASSLKLSKIVPTLDVIGEGNVINVAVYLPLEQEDIDSLHPHAAGGGSPAEAFVNTLCIKRSDSPLKKLKDVLLKGELEKAHNIVEKYHDKDTLANISPSDRLELSRELTFPNNIDMPDWRYIADEYGMSSDIPIFETNILSANSHSRTRALFRLLDHKYHNQVSIGDFLVAVERAGNLKVVDIIEEQLLEIAREEKNQ